MESKESPIAKRIKQARLKAGLSQKQLGIAAGIDEFSASPRINQYERGKHTPDFTMAERLAGALGVPTPFLYASNEELAELILLFERLPSREKRRIMNELREAAKRKGS
jgi:transcriptional regulator with XRE-family HTH domain